MIIFFVVYVYGTFPNFWNFSCSRNFSMFMKLFHAYGSFECLQIFCTFMELFPCSWSFLHIQRNFPMSMELLFPCLCTFFRAYGTFLCLWNFSHVLQTFLLGLTSQKQIEVKRLLKCFCGHFLFFLSVFYCGLKIAYFS